MLPTQPRLLDQVRDRIRLKHYSIRTEDAYVEWIRRFILFQGKRHPREMGAVEVERFLTHLAVFGKVSASTQNQAKSALLFLYKEVLGEELPWLDNIETAKRPARLPVVLTVDEVKAILDGVEGTGGLILQLLYGTGMRILECLRLRVKDVNFIKKEIVVREGKGFKDRVTMLPESLVAPLQVHLRRVASLHARDLEEGYGEVYLPYALARKYPKARARMGVAIRLSVGQTLQRSALGRAAPASRGRAEHPAHHAARGARSGHRQARHAAYPAAQLRHASVGGGL
jgi:integron integrase